MMLAAIFPLSLPSGKIILDVPTNLEPDGHRETFTINAAWLTVLVFIFGVCMGIGKAAVYKRSDHDMNNLKEILTFSASRHSHLCPRQVLGARFGLAGAAALGLDIPRKDKRLLVIIETDGCFADGIEAATGCAVGHRTMRIEDYGKIAATFVDVQTGQAMRVSPRPDARQRAYNYADGETRHYFAQLQAYHVMPDNDLLTMQSVRLKTPIAAIVSRPGVRVHCEMCGEEIINEREVKRHGQTVCHSCAFGSYYLPVVTQPCLVAEQLCML